MRRCEPPLRTDAALTPCWKASRTPCGCAAQRRNIFRAVRPTGRSQNPDQQPDRSFEDGALTNSSSVSADPRHGNDPVCCPILPPGR